MDQTTILIHYHKTNLQTMYLQNINKLQKIPDSSLGFEMFCDPVF